MRARISVWAAIGWLAIPGGLLAVGVTLARHPGVRAWVGPQKLTDWAAVDDAKLHRTFEAYRTPEEVEAANDDTDRPVGHPGLHLEFTMTPTQLRYFRTTNKDAPRSEEEVAVAFDDGPARTAILEVHGWSTQSTDRKSFTVRLFKRQRLTDSCTVRKFILLNMLYDKSSFHMEYCDRLLQELGLFPGYHQYVTVSLNGHSEGIYLLVERPEDAIRRLHPEAVSILRRRWDEAAELKYSVPRADPLRSYHDLVHEPGDVQGSALIAYYRTVLDLDLYLEWLAFNSLVQNSDFLDELFLYELPDPGGRGRLVPVAWDYDDLFKPPAHPRQALTDSLLYACEAAIDRRIQRDPALRALFQATMRRLLNDVLTEAHLTGTLAGVRATLDSIDSGLPAEADAAQKQTRAAEMTRFESQLLVRRQTLLAILARADAASVAGPAALP